MNDLCRRFRVIPSVEQLEDRCTPSANPALPGHGLLGLYFNNPNLQGAPVAQLVSPTIDVLYKLQNGTVLTETPRTASGVPVGGYGENDFSALWEGWLKPNVSGYYTFTTLSDDGVRLYVEHSSSSFTNAMPLIDAFYPQPPTSHRSQPIWLEAGKSYPILLEYNETNQGGAEVHLSWEATNKDGKVVVPEEIVPNKNLFAQNGKKIGEVKFQTAELKQLLKQIKTLPAETQKARFADLKSNFGGDPQKFLDSDSTFLFAATLSDDDSQLLPAFMDNVQFSAPKEFAGSIIQSVTVKKLTTLVDKTTDTKSASFVEGWVRDKDGEAKGLSLGRETRSRLLVRFENG